MGGGYLDGINLSENATRRASKFAFVAVLAWLAGATVAIAASFTPGNPTWSEGPAAPADKGGHGTWIRTFDLTDTETFATIDGSRTYLFGPQKSGFANCYEKQEWDGTLSPDTASPHWVVEISGKVRATVQTNPYSNGTGTYTATATAEIHLESTEYPTPSYRRTASKTVRINAPNQYMSHYAKAGAAASDSSTTPPDTYTQLRYTPTGHACEIRLFVYGSGTITTSRPECTLECHTTVEEDVTGTVAAFDGPTQIGIDYPLD